MNKLRLGVLFILVLFYSKDSYAWGAKGHNLVAEIAFTYLDDDTKKNVLRYLDGMTIQEASVWMDQQRNDKSLDYMKPYHYVNFEKGESVVDNNGNNIISVLAKTINEIKNHKNLSKEEVKLKLLIIFHLVGDIHQPMHVGYGVDKGGNTVQLNFNDKGTNLHSFYDSGIIKYKNISLEDCLDRANFSDRKLMKYKKIDVVEWATESRSFLPAIYNFDSAKVNDRYVNKHAKIIKKQLNLAGIRLASVLQEAFSVV